MLIFLPIMLFSNSPKIPDNSQEMYLLAIPNTLPIILKLNQLETNDM